jgi:hypothetical protein
MANPENQGYAIPQNLDILMLGKVEKWTLVKFKSGL